MTTPWDADPGRYGRLRLDRDMALALRAAERSFIDALWSLRATQPNPSDESYQTLRTIRIHEKILRNIEGLIAEKGWDP